MGWGGRGLLGDRHTGGWTHKSLKQTLHGKGCVYCAREWLKVEAEMCTYVCVLFYPTVFFLSPRDSNPRHGECGGRVCTPNCHLTIIATAMTNNVYAVRMRDTTTHACFLVHSELGRPAGVLIQPMQSAPAAFMS